VLSVLITTTGIIVVRACYVRTNEPLIVCAIVHKVVILISANGWFYTTNTKSQTLIIKLTKTIITTVYPTGRMNDLPKLEKPCTVSWKSHKW